jgi:DNA polymerase III delta prime subunit
MWAMDYAPQKLSDCVLPPKQKDLFTKFLERREVLNLLLSGAPGLGKTTVAKRLIEEAELEAFPVNASLSASMDLLRNDLTRFASTYSLNGEGKVILLDEADNLTKKQQGALRGMIEQHDDVCFLMTANEPGKITEPIRSRVNQIDFGGDRDAEVNADIKLGIKCRIRDICVQEKCEFDDQVVSRVIDDHFPDLRKIVNRAELALLFGY